MNSKPSYYIDPHVHMRDEEWAHKATMADVVAQGKKAGIGLFFDMPNLPRPVTTRERVQERINLAEKRGISENYRLYVGLTSDLEQIKKAVQIVKENKNVVGLKLFAGESTGNLAVENEAEQGRIYCALSDAGYTGVLAVHCEHPEIIKLHKHKFNSCEPWTWADARPAKAEYDSVKKQIEFAKNAGFKGRLQICHVSHAETISLIRTALNDKARTFDIGFELTPHHILRSTEHMKLMSVEDAKKHKCNPPIRDSANQKELLDFLFNLSKNDGLYNRVYLASDFAPHAAEEKSSENPPSGIADFGLYGELEAEAKRRGLNENQIADFMHHYRNQNIVDAFKEKLN
ncbi:MAG: hypothetical protein ABIF85_05350 [Nanoarchaeota archaeon]|nr:hypothetical protein [Nanoarchaeota archaeon]MBU4300729.1 hypothetical protein [Nanoarchaeota archaeon]MBU4452403.1 hypothetical protein [Nanoarchaeota archaeon]MCG2723321.1 hypothetical protein [archaeon]